MPHYLCTAFSTFKLEAMQYGVGLKPPLIAVHQIRDFGVGLRLLLPERSLY
ncbi:hypothetical protein [Nostoc sp. C117]|uniref:hypothetical protein n=1 Tax=Nostoc sp. C117 TaxID=3349875 RepID=UPI00370DD59F